MSDTRYRVINKTTYSIGLTLQNGQQPNIIPGSFITLTGDEICQVDSMSRGRKPFSSGELAISDGVREYTLEEINGFTDPSVTKHYQEDEVETNLKKSANQIKKWLEDINDPVELYSIMDKAEKMDLPQSKLSAVRAKIPGYTSIDS